MGQFYLASNVYGRRCGKKNRDQNNLLKQETNLQNERKHAQRSSSCAVHHARVVTDSSNRRFDMVFQSCCTTSFPMQKMKWNTKKWIFQKLHQSSANHSLFIFIQNLLSSVELHNSDNSMFKLIQNKRRYKRHQYILHDSAPLFSLSVFIFPNKNLRIKEFLKELCKSELRDES